MLCILATILTGYSQQKSINLNDYKFPDYKRHQLELNFNTSGNNRKENFEVFNTTGDLSRKEYSTSNNTSNLTLGYRYDYLTRKRTDFVYSTINGNYSYSKTNNFDPKEEVANSDFQWNLGGFRKYYFTENKLFMEGFTDLFYNLTKHKRTVTGQNDYISDQNYTNLSAGLGIGIGRIEKVSDLWQAYYILEKLNQQGSLSRQLAENDVFEFASLASRLKNKRFFDARLRKIAELKGLDSLMHQQGLINESDISYFTTLNDYWSYGNFKDRYSGKELKLRISPNYTRSYRKYNDNDASIYDKSSIVSTVSFTRTKQLNLYWERRFDALVSYHLQLDTTGNQLYSEPDNKFLSGASLGYGYFPNSRTSIYCNLKYQGENIIIFDELTLEDDSWRNTASVDLTGNYYFSPQLQLTCGIAYSYVDKNYNSTNQTYLNYNLGLRYAIF